MFYKDTRLVYRTALLDSFEWLDYGFGTRQSEAWPPVPPVWVKQIHSAECIIADGASGCLGQADALLTNSPGSYLSIRTADCIPVLLADRRQRAVAAIHAGWRGSAQGIVIKAVERMRDVFGTLPEDLVAAIGPGVCGECYEVGPEVALEFQRWLPERTDLGSQTRIDLAEVNRRQFAAAGLDPAKISTGAPCTLTNPAEFHSWRRDHVKTGRMISAIAILP